MEEKPSKARIDDAADGVIIATPEHNHTTSAALKKHDLNGFPIKISSPLMANQFMIVGASYYQQGSSREQLHLRQNS